MAQKEQNAGAAVDKKESNSQLHVSNGRTRGIEGFVISRRVFRWKHVAGKWPLRRHMEEDAGEKIGVWRRVDHWLMSGFLLAGRSGPNAPSGGVAGWRWSSRRKIFPASRNF